MGERLTRKGKLPWRVNHDSTPMPERLVTQGCDAHVHQTVWKTIDRPTILTFASLSRGKEKEEREEKKRKKSNKSRRKRRIRSIRKIDRRRRDRCKKRRGKDLAWIDVAGFKRFQG